MSSFAPDEELPNTPVAPADFIQYLSESPCSVRESLAPFLVYEGKLRSVFAQQPGHPAIQDNVAGLVPIYNGHEDKLKIRARNLAEEAAEERDRYLMPLDDDVRKENGESAIVGLEEFKKNFNVFSEGALANLDWSNIVASGSSVLTPMLSVPEAFSDSKRSLRAWYHEKIAPTSDVDLFIYGISDEAEAIKRMESIEGTIKDNLLWEVTSVRTKNTITIVSQYPNRHVQIVLRLYKSISEILTGFDVNCACVAYDGKQVYASPRAIASWVTQCNDVDITRRSPSYEHRLAKYRSRGFETYYPLLQRDRIDPTIYERSFKRLQGLARLLVLERLPKSDERESYLDARRQERGRPAKNHFARQRILRGDLKVEGEVPDYEFATEESNYETFHIPYGHGHNAKKTERLLYQKDMLLNAEWNQQAQENRDAYLHRHPIFFGNVEDIKEDCCGNCPVPTNKEEEEIQEYDDKTYVRGPITFLKDDPGRQAIGSFTPLTETDWTEMAYIGDNERLCQAIVANDIEGVKHWAAQEGNEINKRDCTGRTPLHLACWCSTAEVVKTLIDCGARLVARMADGRTALHLAAGRGETETVRALLQKSEENEAIRDEKEDAKNAAKKEATKRGEADFAGDKMEITETTAKDQDGDEEMSEVSEEFEEENSDEASTISMATRTNSVVEVKSAKKDNEGGIPEDAAEEDDDIYDVNVLDWDFHFAPLHHAIIGGHAETVRLLVSDFGADAILPVKLLNDYDGSPRTAILTLALLHEIPVPEQRALMADTLLSLGATVTQADMNNGTAFHWAVNAQNGEVLDVFFDKDNAAIKSVINHVATPKQSYWNNQTETPLSTALQCDNKLALKLLDQGAKGETTFDTFMKMYPNPYKQSSEQRFTTFQNQLKQPVEIALENEAVTVFVRILEMGVDPSLMTQQTYIEVINRSWGDRSEGKTLLDLVRDKIESIELFLNPPKKALSAEEKEKKAIQKEIQVLQLQEIPERVLDQFPANSYERWAAEITMKEANKSFAEARKVTEKPKEPSKVDKILLAEKREKAQELKAQLQKAESILLEKGAKTFAELRPDLVSTKSEPDPYNPYNNPEKLGKEQLLESLEAAKKDYEFTFTFNKAHKVEDINNAYLRLFKAAWDGDVPAMKSLTLMSWGGTGDDSKDPLLITETDTHGFNPFFVAIYRNHSDDVLHAILDIARAQYAPEVMKEKFYLQGAYCSDDEESDLVEEDEDEGDYDGVIERLVDHQFTIDVIAELAKTAKSTVSDMEMMKIEVQSTKFDRAKESIPVYIQGQYDRISPLMLAILRNNEKRANFLLKIAAKNGEDEVASLIHRDSSFQRPGSNYEPGLALRLGRFGILREMIRLTGLGGEFHNIEEDEEGATKKMPKSYPGLSIHGKKRKDWAKSANPDAAYSHASTPPNPMLCYSISHGNLAACDWLFTDEPVNAMLDFGKHLEKIDPEDPRIAAIQKADSKTIARWFGVDHPQLIHAAIIGFGQYYQGITPREVNIVGRLEYVLAKYPNSKNARYGTQGITPLLLAASLNIKDAMKHLLEVGCDPRLKDITTGRNVVHHILTTFRADSVELNHEILDELLALLPEDVKDWGFTQRAVTPNGRVPNTPLSYYLQVGDVGSRWQLNRLSTRSTRKQMLQVILKHSKGADISVRNGLGELPIHIAVKQGNSDVVEVLLANISPELILTENANGMTIVDLVNDKYLLSVVNKEWDIFRIPAREPKNRLIMTMRTEKESESDVDKGPVDYEYTRELVLDKIEQRESGNKRKLVTLWEANETAKRLTLRQKKSTEKLWKKAKVENQKAKGECTDIVELWM